MNISLDSLENLIKSEINKGYIIHVNKSQDEKIDIEVTGEKDITVYVPKQMVKDTINLVQDCYKEAVSKGTIKLNAKQGVEKQIETIFNMRDIKKRLKQIPDMKQEKCDEKNEEAYEHIMEIINMRDMDMYIKKYEDYLDNIKSARTIKKNKKMKRKIKSSGMLSKDDIISILISIKNKSGTFINNFKKHKKIIIAVILASVATTCGVKSIASKEIKDNTMPSITEDSTKEENDFQVINTPTKDYTER